jgi:hypothetical protein
MSIVTIATNLVLEIFFFVGTEFINLDYDFMNTKRKLTALTNTKNYAPTIIMNTTSTCR